MHRGGVQAHFLRHAPAGPVRYPGGRRQGTGQHLLHLHLAGRGLPGGRVRTCSNPSTRYRSCHRHTYFCGVKGASAKVIDPKAINYPLEDSLVQCESEIVHQFPQIRSQMKGGAFQAFEYTYELSVRMIKRYLEQVSANPAEVNGLSFQDLIGTAGQQGLVLSELEAWIRYRANRGMFCQTHIEEKTDRVFQGIREFLDEVRYFLKELQAKNEHFD